MDGHVSSSEMTGSKTKSSFVLFFFSFPLFVCICSSAGIQPTWPYCWCLQNSSHLFLLHDGLRVCCYRWWTHTHATQTVWAQGLVPGHSDSSAGGAPAVEDYDYEASYDYDGNPKTSATTNSTRYALAFDTKLSFFFSFLVAPPFLFFFIYIFKKYLSILCVLFFFPFYTLSMDITMYINSKYLPLTITTWKENADL